MIGWLTMVADYAKGGGGNAVCALILAAGMLGMGIWVSERFISKSEANEYATRSDTAVLRQEIAELRDDIREDIADIHKDVGEINTRNYDFDLVAVQERFCEAWTARNVSAQRFAGDRKRALMEEFVKDYGRNPYVPNCEELGYVNLSPMPGGN